MIEKPQQPTTDRISRHYDRIDIEQEIQKAVERSGRDLSEINRSDLSALDELHIGGKTATMDLARKSSLSPGSLILDVGSGLGGPARSLAAEMAYRVIGIDITESFCRMAQRFTSMVDMASTTAFICSDALRLPFRSGSFDGIWSQHCSMNIPDKNRLYEEYYRVLREGGSLMIHDVVAGDTSPINFPVPWADSESISFLVNESELQAQLSAAGFSECHRRDITADALAWFEKQKTDPDRKRSVFNQKMVYGDNLLTMVRNMIRNLKENRMRIVEVILNR